MPKEYYVFEIMSTCILSNYVDINFFVCKRKKDLQNMEIIL